MRPVLHAPIRLVIFALQAVAWGLCALVLCLWPHPVQGQEAAKAEQGRLFLTTYPSQDYGASPQNFDVIVGPRGRIYAANSRGVLSYDGETWTLVKMPNQAPARSLAQTKNGTIYVGGQGELGVLRRGPHGSLRYESLLDEVPEAHSAVSPVWKTHAVGNTVYFGTEKALFRWRDGEMYVWEGPFYLTLEARGTVYVQVPGGDVMQVEGDTLVPVPGLEEAPVTYFIAPLGRDALLLGSHEKGLMRYAEGKTTRWPAGTGVSPADHKVYSARALPNGGVAVGTQTAGVFVYGPDGTLRRRLTQESGLNDNYVYGLALDHSGGLWLAQGRGLARAGRHHPLTRYGDVEGLSGNVLDVIRMDGTLYVGTMDGLFVLRPASAPGRPGRFERISRATVVHDLLPFGSTLLATSNMGLVEVNNEEARMVEISNRDRTVTTGLARVPTHPNRLYLGTFTSVAVIEKANGRWRQTHRLPLSEMASRLEVGPGGTLWVGTELGAIYQIPGSLATARPPDATITRLDTAHGLPSMRYNIPYRVEDRIVIGTTDGPYRFESSSSRFVPDTSLRRALPGASRYVGPIEDGNEGEIWMHVGEAANPVTGLLHPDSSGGYSWHTGPLRRLLGFTTYVIYPDGAATWIGGPGLGPEALLVRYAPSPVPSTRGRRAPPTLLQQAALVGHDSTLALVGPNDNSTAPTVAPSHNSVRFEYAAPAYDAPDATRFRVRLRRNGADADWSPWRPTTEATYTTLGPGRYVFEVQARDVYRRVGPPTAVAFTVLPPWYRTWWAYGLYLLAAAGAVGGLLWGRTRQLRYRQRRLRATVDRRTAEVRRQKHTLERQAEELKALDDAKSRFFANLSHEFRTPLTLILGPVQRLQDALSSDDPPPDATEQLTLVERNTYRLLRMVRQLLDLARSDAGTLRLRAQPTDLAAAAERIARSFVPLAERHRVALTVEPTPVPDDAAPLYLDPEKGEQILGNLLSNALKFTPEGGRVTVRVGGDRDAARLQVVDTGVGLSAEEQDRIFERFAQVQPPGDAAARASSGAGIGLALTHTLVELHGGTLTVESTKGEGTTFTVTIPRGRAHLTDEDIAPDAARPSPEAAPAPPSEQSSPLADATVEPDSDPSANAGAGETATDDSPPLVLVVDDNPDVRAYVRSVLTPAFRVVGAGTGAEGLATAREQLPDVILADVMMPELDGLQMTEQLRADARTAALPVVMLTARAGIEDEVEGLAAGATDYIVKPFDPQVLEMRVRGTLAYQQRLRRALLNSADSPEEEPSDSSGAEGAPPSFEKKMRSVIAQHFPDPAFGPEGLAEALAMSRSTLYRRAREADAPSPAQLIRTMRLERGAELLAEDAGTVSEVAYAVGFNSLSHFSRQFADHFDRPPTEYAARADGD